MKQLIDFSDGRLRGRCPHCGEWLGGREETRDHVPTKSLLAKPFPENLPVVGVCMECNASFSKDEEYVVALLASVICGSTSPDPKRFPVAARALRRSDRLRDRIERIRGVQETLWGDSETQWDVELDRVARVIVKNARGHVLFELGQPVFGPPSHVAITPLQRMSDQRRHQFENWPTDAFWPEVGSRSMQRMATGECGLGGWLTIQEGVYRFAASEPFHVRISLYEYLAAEVAWDESASIE